MLPIDVYAGRGATVSVKMAPTATLAAFQAVLAARLGSPGPGSGVKYAGAGGTARLGQLVLSLSLSWANLFGRGLGGRWIAKCRWLLLSIQQGGGC